MFHHVLGKMLQCDKHSCRNIYCLFQTAAISQSFFNDENYCTVTLHVSYWKIGNLNFHLNKYEFHCSFYKSYFNNCSTISN